MRMAKLDRAMRLVNLLADSVEGLTLDEMAVALGVDRRTAERLRNVIREHFNLDEQIDDERRKRFRIREGVRRTWQRPLPSEVAALRAEALARRQEGAPQALQLEALLGKISLWLDDRERTRMAPDLEALVRLQRARVTAGPHVVADPQVLATVQQAILSGCCLEFEYMRDGASEAAWRRVVPFGIVHGPVTYLVGKLPEREEKPVFFRLDRMNEVRVSNTLGCAPEDWDLDGWMAESFGIWHDVPHEIVLRVAPASVERARAWRFHPAQIIEADGDELVVRFQTGGLRELAEHLFTWGGDVRIEAPDALRATMRERLDAAEHALRPIMSHAGASEAA